MSNSTLHNPTNDSLGSMSNIPQQIPKEEDYPAPQMDSLRNISVTSNTGSTTNNSSSTATDFSNTTTSSRSTSNNNDEDSDSDDTDTSEGNTDTSEEDSDDSDDTDDTSSPSSDTDESSDDSSTVDDEEEEGDTDDDDDDETNGTTTTGSESTTDTTTILTTSSQPSESYISENRIRNHSSVPSLVSVSNSVSSSSVYHDYTRLANLQKIKLHKSSSSSSTGSASHMGDTPSMQSSTDSSYFLYAPPSSPYSVGHPNNNNNNYGSMVHHHPSSPSLMDHFPYSNQRDNNDEHTLSYAIPYPRSSPIYSLRTTDGAVCRDPSITSSIPFSMDNEDDSIHTFPTVNQSSIVSSPYGLPPTSSPSVIIHSSHIADGDDELLVTPSPPHGSSSSSSVQPVVTALSRSKSNTNTAPYPSYSPLSTSVTNNTSATELALRAISQSEQRVAQQAKTLQNRTTSSSPLVTVPEKNPYYSEVSSTVDTASSLSDLSLTSSYPRMHGKRVSKEAALIFRKRIREELLSPMHTTAEMRTRYLMFQKYISSAVHSAQRGTGMYTTDTSPDVSNISSARTQLIAACLANDDGIMLRMFISHLDIPLDIDGPLPVAVENYPVSPSRNSNNKDNDSRSLSKLSSSIFNQQFQPQSLSAPSTPSRLPPKLRTKDQPPVPLREPFLFGQRIPTPPTTVSSSSVSTVSIGDKTTNLFLPSLSNRSVYTESQRSLGSIGSSSHYSAGILTIDPPLPIPTTLHSSPRKESVPNTILQRLAQFSKPYNYPSSSSSFTNDASHTTVATSIAPQAQSSLTIAAPTVTSFLSPRFISLGKLTPSHSTPLITCIYLSKAKESKEIRESALHRIKLLLSAGADPNFRAPAAEQSLPLTPLMVAVRLNQPAIVKLLLSYGADPNASRLPENIPQGKPYLSKFLSKKVIQKLQRKRTKLMKKLSQVNELSTILEQSETEQHSTISDKAKQPMDQTFEHEYPPPSGALPSVAEGSPKVPPPPTDNVRLAAIANLNPSTFIVAPVTSIIGKINNAATVRFDDSSGKHLSSSEFTVPIGAIRSSAHIRKRLPPKPSRYKTEPPIDFDKDIDTVVDPLLDADEQAGIALPNILYTAIAFLSLPIIKLLLQYSAKVDAAGPHGYTPLRYLFTIITPEEAETSRVISIVQLLIGYGANVNTTVYSTWEYRESTHQLQEQKRQRQKKKQGKFKKQLRKLIKRSQNETTMINNNPSGIVDTNSSLLSIDSSSSNLHESVESKVGLYREHSGPNTSLPSTATNTATAVPVLTTVPKLEVNMDGTIVNRKNPDKLLYKYRICNDGRCIDIAGNRGYVTLFRLLVDAGADLRPLTFDWTPTADLYGKLHVQMNDFDYIYRANQRYGSNTSNGSRIIDSDTLKTKKNYPLPFSSFPLPSSSSHSSDTFTQGFARHMMDTLLPGSVPKHLLPDVSSNLLQTLYMDDPNFSDQNTSSTKKRTLLPDASSKTFASSIVSSSTSSSTVRYIHEMDGVTYVHALFREGYRIKTNYVETAWRKGYHRIIELAAGFGVPVEKYRKKLLRNIAKEKQRRERKKDGI